MSYKRIEQYDEQCTASLIKSYKEALGQLGESELGQISRRRE
ncbi:MAG: hypothetical protein RIQ34_1183 [Bacteroidota bacterium]